MTVFSSRIKETIEKAFKSPDRMKREFRLEKTLFEFKWRYLYAVAKKAGLQFPVRLMSMAIKSLSRK